MLSFFPRDVLDEILGLIESVSEGFPTYSCETGPRYLITLFYLLLLLYCTHFITELHFNYGIIVYVYVIYHMTSL